MPPLAMLIIIAILRGVSSSDRLQVSALSLVFGGAIGNYIDRVRFRYVIDFLDFHLQEKYTWPAFNIADAAIVLGMIALVYIIIKEPQAETAADASGN
jgi:signal peptidase II